MANALAPVPEFIILGGLLKKEISHQEVERKTLTQMGGLIHKIISQLAEKGDWDVQGVTAAAEALGADRQRLQEYLTYVQKYDTVNAKDVHAIIHDRNVLLQMQNEINSQLVTGDFDVPRIQTFNGLRTSTNRNLSSVEDDLAGGAPESPGGPPLKTLPKLSGYTNGVFGLWLVGGIPGLGKSTLANQCTSDITRPMSGLKGLYYDIENGKRVLLSRLVQNFGLERARQLGARWFIRESVRTLTSDLTHVKPPAVIVVDSIQKVPVKGDDHREGLDSWIRRFEQIKQDGYIVILVSEVPRDKYTGDPKLDMFKESGALEYAADVAVALTDRGNGMIQSHIVKNRHNPYKGPVAMMERSKPFWFKEVDLGIAGFQ